MLAVFADFVLDLIEIGIAFMKIFDELCARFVCRRYCSDTIIHAAVIFIVLGHNSMKIIYIKKAIRLPSSTKNTNTSL